MSNYLVDGSDLTSVADAIRAKSGGSSDLAFPAGFVSEIQAIPTGGGGQTIYTSSTGLLYTPIMTIDLSMERSNGYMISDVLTRYGDMPLLEDLTLTGIVRNSAANAMSITAGSLSTAHYPALKKLTIAPTEIRTNNGTAYDASNSYYNKLKIAHYAFNGTNLRQLVLGKIGGPYLIGSGYFRNDMPQPPGTGETQAGSADGLGLEVYAAEYSASGCFTGSLAPNTTLTVRDYETGEVLTT